MTTSISSEAMWNFKKYVWTSENCHNKEIKYQPRNKFFYIFTSLPFVAWLTDWYGKQKVEKEIIKIKEIKKSRNLSTIIKYLLIYVFYSLNEIHTVKIFME